MILLKTVSLAFLNNPTLIWLISSFTSNVSSIKEVSVVVFSSVNESSLVIVLSSFKSTFFSSLLLETSDVFSSSLETSVLVSSLLRGLTTLSLSSVFSVLLISSVVFSLSPTVGSLSSVESSCFVDSIISFSNLTKLKILLLLTVSFTSSVLIRSLSISNVISFKLRFLIFAPFNESNKT